MIFPGVLWLSRLTFWVVLCFGINTHPKNNSHPLSFEDSEEDKKYACFCMSWQNSSEDIIVLMMLFSFVLSLSIIFLHVQFSLTVSKHFLYYLSQPNNFSFRFLSCVKLILSDTDPVFLGNPLPSSGLWTVPKTAVILTDRSLIYFFSFNSSFPSQSITVTDKK